MCTSKWSNHDLFTIYTDCHIYRPIALFLYSIIFILGVVGFLLGVVQTWKMKRKDIAATSMGSGFFTSLTFGIMLGTDITFADRNVALNLFHALALSMCFLNVTLHAYRHIQVVISVDTHTMASSRSYDKIIVKFNAIFIVTSFINNLVTLLVPIWDYSLDFPIFFGCLQFVFGGISGVPLMVYIWRLKKIILSIITERNTKFYSPILSTLQGFFNYTFYGTLFGFTITLSWMFIPVLDRNVYIVYSIFHLFVPLTGIVNLLDVMKKPHEENPHYINRGIGTKTEMEKKSARGGGEEGGSEGSHAGEGGGRNDHRSKEEGNSLCDRSAPSTSSPVDDNSQHSPIKTPTESSPIMDQHSSSGNLPDVQLSLMEGNEKKTSQEVEGAAALVKSPSREGLHLWNPYIGNGKQETNSIPGS